MIAGALHFLIQTIGNLFVIAVLLRFMMQLFRVPFRNPSRSSSSRSPISR